MSAVLLDLLTGARRPRDRREATVRADVTAATATLTVSAGAPDGDTTTLWIGQTHTTIVRGQDPVEVGRIRTANTPFALIDLLGLVREGSAAPPGPGTVPRMRFVSV